MLRFLVLALGLLWAVAGIGRLTRRLGRGPLQPVRGARPVIAPPARPDRLIGVFRAVAGIVLVLVFAGVLFAVTDLSEVVVVLIAAPVAGVVSSLVTERFVSEDDPGPD